MNNVWYSIITFLKKLFVPPTYTTLEHELLRQISWLEGELHRAQEERRELLEKFIPSNNSPEPNEENLAPLPTKPSWEARRTELEEDSKRRKRELEVAAYIKQQEAIIRGEDEEERKQGSPSTHEG